MDVTVALAQIKPKLGCIADNLAIIEAAIERGIREKAGLIIFPELALTGYFLKDLVPEVALPLHAPEIARLVELSRHISIAVGFVEVSSDYRFFNSALYLEGGEIKHVHRKVYLPTYGMFDEGRYFAAGRHFKAFDTRFGRLGVLICEDAWHLSSSYLLALQGAHTLLVMSGSPGRGLATDRVEATSVQTWERVGQTLSQFLTLHWAYVNRVGYEDWF